MGYWLDPIGRYCINNSLPDLTGLVVRVDTGEPGDGYLGDRDALNSDREVVYNHDWFDLVPPTGEELRAAGESKR